MMIRLFYACAVLAAFGALALAPAAAQVTINENERLHFGRWVVTNNQSNHNIIINSNGSYSHSPSLIMLETPRAGEYFVSGLTSFAVINNVHVTQTSPMSGPGGQSFMLDNFDVICPNADFDGNTVLTLGARATLSGNAAPYANGNYAGQLTVAIDY